MKLKFFLGFLAMLFALNSALGQTTYYDCSGNAYSTKPSSGSVLTFSNVLGITTLSGEVCGTLVIDGDQSIVYNGKTVFSLSQTSVLSSIGDITVTAGSTMTIKNYHCVVPGVRMALSNNLTVLGTLNVENSSLDGYYSTLNTPNQLFRTIQIGDASNHGTVVMTGSNIRRGGLSSTGALSVVNGSLSMTDCTIDSLATGAAAVYVNNLAANSVTITGGNFTSRTATPVFNTFGGTSSISNATLTALATNGYPLLISGDAAIVKLQNSTFTTNSTTIAAITLQAVGNFQDLGGNTLHDNFNRINVTATAVNGSCSLSKSTIPYYFTSALSVNAGGSLTVAAGATLNFASTVSVKGALTTNGTATDPVIFNKTSTGNILEVSGGGTLNLTYANVNALSGIRTNDGVTNLNHSTLNATAGSGLIIGQEGGKTSLVASSVMASDKDIQFIAGGDVAFDSASSLTGSNTVYTFEFSSLNSTMNLPLMRKTVVVPNNFTVNANGIWNIAPGNTFNTGLIKISGVVNAPSTAGSQITFVSTAGMFDMLANGTLKASNILANAAGNAITMDGGAATVDNCIFNITAGDGITFNAASSLTVSNTSFSLATASFPLTYAAGGGTLNWGAGNSFSGGRNYARVTFSSLSANMYLPEFLLPYVFTTGSDFTIASTGKLEIASNNIVKFNNWFQVQGTLKAEAASGKSILFTSNNDDNAGGNTTGSASITPVVGSWGGISFNGTTSNASSLNGCELRFGGKSNHGVIICNSQTAPTIQNCNLNNSYYGFELQSGAAPKLTSNTIGSSQVVPMAMTLDCNPVMLNNVFSTSHNQYDAIGIISGTLAYDAHIIKRDFTNIPNVTYVLLGTVTNPAGKTLTIDPGVVIKSKASGDYISNMGTLKAQGTATDKIIFSSINDDSCGNPADTQSNGNTTVPAANNWSGIYFGNTSTAASIMDYCEVRYAAQTNLSGYNGGAISIQNASPTISNTRVAFTTYGIAAIQGSNPAINNVTIETTSSAPVAVSMTANPTFTNVTYNSVAYQAIGIFSETLSVSGNLSQKSIAGYDNITYVTLGDITIPSGINVTVDAGVVIKPLNGNVDIFVDGGFKINGTAEAPVVFTSINDDSYGNPGDTRLDGNATSAKAGDWGSIVYRATSDNTFNVINNALLFWGGNYGYNPIGNTYYALLHCINSSPTIKNTRISNSSNAGIIAGGSAAPVLTENVVIENTAGYPIVMSLTANPQMNINSPIFNTSKRAISLTDEVISTAITLNKRSVSGFDNIPYVIPTVYPALTVAAGGKLTVSPGIIIKFDGNSNDNIIVNGALVAEGTAAEPVVFTSLYDDSQGGDTDGTTTVPNSANNGWLSIVFNASATQNQNSLKNCLFAYGSASSTNDKNGMLRINNSYANIENCRFENGNYEAIYIIGNSNPVIKDCSFTNLNRTPIQLSMFSSPVFQGNNILTNVAIRALGLRIETWGADGVCPKRNFAGYDNITYYIGEGSFMGHISINSGAHITIPAGMVFKHGTSNGGGGSADGADIDVNGNLTIAGTSAEPVVFTHVDDDNYGNPRDTRSNGNISPTSSFSNNNNVYLNFNAGSDDASSINNAIFAYSPKHAVYLMSSSPTITNTRFENLSSGVFLAGSSHPTINNCIFNNLTYTPTIQSLMSNIVTSDNATSAGNVISGTTYRALGIFSEELTQDYTLNKKAFAGLANIPYYFSDYTGDVWANTNSNSYRIGTSATLTINPGVICKFKDVFNITMDVKRGLRVLGTPAEKVIFTSIKDDFYGGDTNMDGTTAAGTWSGITFENTAIKDSCLIDNAVIRYATYKAGITTNGSSPTITNSSIYDCINGVVANLASNPVIHNCDIYNITNYAVNNVNQVFTIDATNNWWGDNSGPTHSGNPGGTGTKVSDMVNYSPFVITGTANPIMGDVSLNGIVQAYDASLVLQHTVGNITLAGKQLLVADVSGDGTISALDASLILMYVAGTNSSFPTMRSSVQPDGDLALAAGNIAYNGNTVSVPFNLVNAGNIRSAEWTAAYDPRVLRPVSVEGSEGVMSAYRIDEENGEILFSMAMENAVSGNVNMATVVFEVLTGDATTLITSDNLNIDETDFTDSANPIEIALKAPTGINSETVNAGLEVIQTGSSLEIRFANSNSENVKVELYDMSGRLIIQRATTAESMTIDKPNKSGVYIIRLTGGNLNATKKIVVK